LLRRSTEAYTPDLVGVEYQPFAVVLEVHDELRRLSGFDPAEGVDAEDDALLVIDVEEADAPVRVRPHQSLRGEDAGDAGPISAIAQLLMISRSEWGAVPSFMLRGTKFSCAV